MIDEWGFCDLIYRWYISIHQFAKLKPWSNVDASRWKVARQERYLDYSYCVAIQTRIKVNGTHDKNILALTANGYLESQKSMAINSNQQSLIVKRPDFCDYKFSLIGKYQSIRPRQIVLGNFWATFWILSNFLANEQLRATFPKVSTFWATVSLFQPRSTIFDVLNISSFVIW